MGWALGGVVLSDADPGHTLGGERDERQQHCQR